MKRKGAYMAQYYCPHPLKPEFYGIGPPKLLEAIHVDTTF